jgi:hypothetical protein
LQSSRDGRHGRRGNPDAFLDAQSLEKFRTEAALRLPMSVKKGWIQARRRRHHLAEQSRVPLIAGCRDPLDFMFFGAGAIAQ